MKFYRRVGCFGGCSGSQKNMKFVLKGRIRFIFKIFPEPFYSLCGPSFVELTGDDNSATSTVAVIRMSLSEYAWPSHIYSRVWINHG